MSEYINCLFYRKELNKSIEDKMFFVDKLPNNIKVFFDYGCGDGTLLKKLKLKYPTSICVGYDISEQMITAAEYNTNNCLFFTSLLDAIEKISYESESCIILSSVMHEIHSNLPDENILYFYEFLFNFGFKYIVIRDMTVNESEVNVNTDKVFLKSVLSKVHSLDFIEELKSYNKVWPLISNYKSFLHFLLKYRYKRNWKKELYENYFAFDGYNFLTKIPNNYIVKYNRFFCFPWFQKHLKDTFNIDVKTPTHCEIILEKIK